MFVDDLPKNDRGKVDKKLLIEREQRGELDSSRDREVPRAAHDRERCETLVGGKRARDRARPGRLDRAARPAPRPRHRRRDLARRRACARAELLEKRGTMIGVIAPAVRYGVTECATGFAGAVSVPADVLTAYIAAVVRRPARAAASATCASSTTTSSPRTTRRCARCSPAATSKVSVACPLTKKWARTLSAEFKSGACHAGPLRDVDRDGRGARARRRGDARACSPPVPISLSEQARAPASTTFDAMGMELAYAGDPAAATVEEGEQLIQRLGEMVVGEVLEALGIKPAS